MIQRRNFIGLCTLIFPSAIIPAFFLSRGSLYAILPVEGVYYSESFLAFCQTARFASAKQALRSVKDPDLVFEIVRVETNQGNTPFSPASQASQRETHGIPALAPEHFPYG